MCNWDEIVSEIMLTSECIEREETKKAVSNPRYIVEGENSSSYILPDICGGAYVKFKDLRSKAYKTYKKWYEEKYENDPYGMFHDYGTATQLYNVNVAVAKNVASIINKAFGDSVYVKTYID